MLTLQFVEKFLSKAESPDDRVRGLAEWLEAAGKDNEHLEDEVANALNEWNTASDEERLSTYLDWVDRYISKGHIEAQSAVTYHWLATNNPVPLPIFLNHFLPRIPDDHKINALSVWLGVTKNQEEGSRLIQPILKSLEENTAINVDEHDGEIKVLLAFVKTEKDKALLVSAWLKNSNNDISETTLKQIYPLTKGGRYAADGLAGWATKPDDGLFRIIKLIHIIQENKTEEDKQDGNESNKVGRVTEKWIDQPENKLDADVLEKTLPKLQLEVEKLFAIELWVRKNKASLDPQDFIKFANALTNPDFKSQLASQLLFKAFEHYGRDVYNLTFEQFYTVVRLLTDASKQGSFAVKWLESTKHAIAYEQLSQLLALIPEKESYEKSRILEQWMDNTKNKPNSKAINDLFALPTYKRDEDRYEFVLSVIKNNRMDSMMLAEIRQFFSESDFRYMRILKAWLAKPENIPDEKVIVDLFPSAETKTREVIAKKWAENSGQADDIDTVVKIAKALDGNGSGQPLDFLEFWIKYSPSLISSDDTSKIAESVFGLDDDSKILFYNGFLNGRKTTSIDVITFGKSLRNENKKYSFIEKCIKSGVKFSLASASEIITLFESKTYKSLISEAIIKTLKVTPFNIIKVAAFYTDDYQRAELIKSYIDSNKEIGIDQLGEMLELFSNNYYNDPIVNKWLNTCKTPDERLSKFIELVHSNAYVSPFDLREIFSAFEGTGFKSGQVPTLCKNLYPQNEVAQVDMFYYAVQISIIPKTELPVRISEFAASFQDDDQCLQVLTLGLGHGLTPFDVMMVARDRLSSNFSSLENVLDISIEEALTDRGYYEVKQLFKDAPEDFDFSKLKLSAIFSYYDITKNMNEFRIKIKPEISEKFNANFSPTQNAPFIRDDEHHKLTALHIDPLPTLLDLCKYLKDNLRPVPSLEYSRNMMALQVAMMHDAGPASWEQQYLDLLDKGDDLTKEEVLTFFNMITGFDLNEDEGSKLLRLIKDREAELTYLFSQKDGILDYVGIVGSIGDGCIANMGTKTTIYLYSKLLKTAEAKVLYPFHCEEIAVPLLRTRGSDRLGASSEGANPLTNTYILQAHISPPGFLKALAKYIKESKINAYKFIEKTVSPDELLAYVDNIFGQDEKETEIAAYVLIRNTMPSLLDHPSFSSVKEEYEQFFVPEVDEEEEKDTASLSTKPT